MAIYYFAAAFQSADPVSEDGLHLEAQYGFAVDAGNGVAALGSSGTGGRTFESVAIPAGAGGQQNQFVVSVCSDLIGIDQSRSFVRVSFRPAHDVPPAANLPLAPVVQNGAQGLLTGYTLNGTGVTAREEITNGTKFGLPQDSYATQWLLPAAQFVGGQPPGTSLHFEVSVEIAVVESGSSNWTYYKVDPEMQIDF